MAKILVVEDEPVQRTLITTILKRDEHEVTACASAREAVEALSFFEFDLIVTDIVMPGQDGFDVIQAARNLRPDARIIVLSGIDQQVPGDLTAVAFRKLNVNRVIPKPVKPADLATEVLAVLVAG